MRGSPAREAGGTVTILAKGDWHDQIQLSHVNNAIDMVHNSENQTQLFIR